MKTSNILMSRVYEAASLDKRLSAHDGYLLALLCNQADEHGRCSSSQQHMRHKWGVGRIVILKHIKRLQRFGYLSREYNNRREGSATLRDSYTISVPSIPPMRSVRPRNSAPPKPLLSPGEAWLRSLV